MNALPRYLSGPSYVLGEVAGDYTGIADLPARAARLRLAADPDLWGWGGVFRTERGVAAMAIDSGTATLAAAGVPAGAVDALIVCCTEVPGPPAGHGRFIEDVLTGIGLGDVAFFGLNLNRCVNLLAAIDVASAFVAAGRFHRILVVTTDRVTDERDRMANYALFSDGAAGCLVSAEPGAQGFEILGCATACDRSSLESFHEISADLAREVNDRLLTPLGMKPGDLDALMHGNIFKPLLVMKERQAGFTRDQIYPDNIARVGHCFSADPLINLVDRTALGHVRPGRHTMLAASVPGARNGVLLRKLDE